MARTARIVVPGYPHYVTQRGHRRQPVFFRDKDYRTYLDLMAAACQKERVSVLAWCLMPHQVHLVVVPKTAAGLARAMGEAHRRYTRAINLRKNRRGYLWQGRFASCVMDRRHTRAAVRYVERNPVRAGRVKRAENWPWSSAAAHVSGRGDSLVRPGGPILAGVKDWRRFLRGGDDEAMEERLRRHGRMGRPLGDPAFMRRLGRRIGRPGRPKKGK